MEIMTVLRLLSPTSYLIETALSSALTAFTVTASKENVTTDELSKEARKANIKSNVLIEQAKVEQESSIAKRILIAEEVDIEEYYDIAGSGGAGLKTDGSTFSLGAQAEGKKVTKRVFKFKGFNPEAMELLLSAAAAEKVEKE